MTITVRDGQHLIIEDQRHFQTNLNKNAISGIDDLSLFSQSQKKFIIFYQRYLNLTRIKYSVKIINSLIMVTLKKRRKMKNFFSIPLNLNQYP